MMRMTQNEKIRHLMELFKEISISKTKEGMYKAQPESAQFRPRGGDGWYRTAGVGRTAQESLVRLFDLVSSAGAETGNSDVEVKITSRDYDIGIKWDRKKKNFIATPYNFSDRVS